MNSNKKPSPSFLSQTNPWLHNSNNIWFATTLRLYRNISSFKFPGKLDISQKNQLMDLVQKSILNLKELEKPSLKQAEEMDPLEKEFLYEHFLSSNSFHQAHKGEAFITDNTGEFLAIINLRDHLQLQLTDCSSEPEQTWNKLVQIETSLGQSLDFSFSPKFGFLTATPSLCGTGLVISTFLHVPALIHTAQLDNTLQTQKREDIDTTGMQGNLDDLVGDIITLHNNYTLGLTEEDILSALHTSTTKLIVAEKSARTKIKAENSPDLRDKISRAFGLLTHSYCLETKEALGALSMCKLGIDLDWITGISHTTLNYLFLACQRAHLLQQKPEKISQDEIPQMRAEFLHESLKSASLSALST